LTNSPNQHVEIAELEYRRTNNGENQDNNGENLEENREEISPLHQYFMQGARGGETASRSDSDRAQINIVSESSSDQAQGAVPHQLQGAVIDKANEASPAGAESIQRHASEAQPQPNDGLPPLISASNSVHAQEGSSVDGIRSIMQ
jgi:hypothetical protein